MPSIKIASGYTGPGGSTVALANLTNALNAAGWHALAQNIQTLGQQPDVRVIVIRAEGRGFCAGVDIKELNENPDLIVSVNAGNYATFKAVHLNPVPVIAAVSGHAYAGVLELVLACDFAIGVDGARFAFTEVTIGLVPGLGGTQLLARAVGERRAKELILTGRAFTAGEALAWGVLQRVCTRADLDDVVIAVATTIAANAPLAVAAAKRAIHDGLDTDLAAALRLELAAYDTLVPTDDRRVGVRSFRTREKPRFSGR